MMIRKKSMIAGIAFALFLSACGGNSADNAGNTGANGAAGEANVSVADESQSMQGEQAAADGQAHTEQNLVVNNAGCFVKKGEEIFFATDTKLYAYHEATGKLREISDLKKDEYTDNWKLFYCDGWIYYEMYDTEKENTWVFRINAESGEKEAVCQGYLEGVSEDARYLFISNYDNDLSKLVLAVYEGDKSVKNLQAEADLQYCGNSGDYVFAMISDYSGETSSYQIFAAKISEPDVLLNLGDVPCLNEDGYWYEYPDMTQVLVDGEKGYFSLSYYAGTGMFYNGGCLCEADLTKEGSLAVLDADDVDSLSRENADMSGTEYEDEMSAEVYLWLEDGTLKSGHGLPNTARYSGSYGGSGIITYDENGTESLFYPGLVSPADPETFLEEELQEIAVIDGDYYMIRKRLFNDPSQAIGWRSYYETVNTEYIRMDTQGTITVLAEEPADLVLSGYVALGSGKDYIYFQPTDTYEDYEGMPSENLAYTMAKVYLAEDNVVSEWEEFLSENPDNRKALSALKEYGVETFADAEVDFNGYQGYSVSGTESISGQRFLLRFDKDGKLLQIAPDYAG